jgi:hypothetical protein
MQHATWSASYIDWLVCERWVHEQSHTFCMDVKAKGLGSENLTDIGKIE